MDLEFRGLQLHRRSSWCIAGNAVSVRVLGKAGLRLEGRLCESEHLKSRWWDTLLYGLLDSEWRACWTSAVEGTPGTVSFSPWRVGTEDAGTFLNTSAFLAAPTCGLRGHGPATG